MGLVSSDACPLERHYHSRAIHGTIAPGGCLDRRIHLARHRARIPFWYAFFRAAHADDQRRVHYFHSLHDPDPATTPLNPSRQALFGFSVAIVYAILQVLHLVFGLFFALLAVCAIRGLALHLGASGATSLPCRAGEHVNAVIGGCGNGAGVPYATLGARGLLGPRETPLGNAPSFA
jgi:hypothetical protein